MEVFMKKILSIITYIAVGLITMAHAQSSNKQIISLSNPAELTKLISSQELVVVVFSKPSCPFCTFIKPHIRSAVQSSPKNITLVEYNILSNPDYYKKTYKFSTVPTVIYYKNGKEVYRHDSMNRGATSAKISSIISTHFA